MVVVVITVSDDSIDDTSSGKDNDVSGGDMVRVTPI